MRLFKYSPTPLMLPTSHYDGRRADFAVNFISMLKHTTGEWYGKPFRLMPWQEQIVRDIFGIVDENGFRQFRTAYVEVGKKNGKQVALDTLIPTPSGFTTMEDISVGDYVFDERGEICRVLAKSDVDYAEQAYRITFKDGEIIEAGENHQWFGEWGCGNQRKSGVVNTDWLYKRSKTPYYLYNNSLDFRIPMAKAIKIESANLPIHPYLMGYWLGNGNSIKPEITIQTCDIAEILANITPYHEVSSSWDNTGDSRVFRIPDLKSVLLRSYHDKVIPIEYLRSGYEQRLLLLQGLMDSDGCISKTQGQGIYSSTERALAKSVSDLLWTLGIKNSINKSRSSQRKDWSKSSADGGREFTGETLYQAKYTAFADTPTASLKRKQSHAIERNPKSPCNYRYVDKVELIKNRGMQCIQVDSMSHMYLVGRSFLPTHNSELAAALALYLLFADGEAGAEVYSCAADINQASIVFGVARAMVEQCPDLLKLSKLVPSTKRIIFPHTNSFYRVLSSETKSKQGFNVSGLIFDELFAQQTRELFDTMTKFTGDARRQPLYFLITTAGRDKTSICYEIHCKAQAVMEGSKIDPAFYPAVFGIKEGDNWDDERVWRRVNPSIDVTIPFDTVQAAYEQAKQNPAEEMHFRQFRLNEWCNADIRWMPMDKWDACGDQRDDGFNSLSAQALLEHEMEGRDCYCGLDLSSTGDLTALVLVFPPIGGETRYTVLPYYWLPDEVIDLRTRRDHVPYAVWKKQGVFNTTEGNVVDYDYIVAFIAKLSERFRIREIAYDRYGAEKIRRDLEELGAEHGFVVFPFGQGFISMSPPSKDFYQFVMEGRIRHSRHPVLDWNMSNVIIDQDAAGNIKPNKKKSTEKIDGVVALIMGIARASTIHFLTDSVYSERGLLFI